MRAPLLLLFLGAAAGPQDLEPQVLELVTKMGEDDIDVADQAAAELQKIGPPALPALRECARKRHGDLKLRLDELVRKIERGEKVRKAVGRVPRVTARFQDRPVSEILEEISKQSGVRVEGRDVPAEARASLAAEDAPVWKAIDELCRGHGGLMYTFTPKRVLVKPAPYRDLPRVFDRGFMFFLDTINWTRSFNGGAHSYFHAQAAVAWPPGVRPISGALLLDELTDDKNTDLLQAANGGNVWYGRSANANPQDEGTILLPLNHQPPTPPAEDATALSRFKGKVALKFALEMKRTISIQDPLGQRAASEKYGKTTLQMRAWKRKGKEVRLDLSLTSFRRPNEMNQPWDGNFAGRIVLVDPAGKTYTGRPEQQGSSSSGGTEGYTITQNFAMTFAVPESTAVASLDWIEPTEVEEVVIPFDFKGVPLQ